MPTGQFALCFALLYAAVKWNYVVPLFLQPTALRTKNTKARQLLLFGIAGFVNGTIVLLWDAPSLSPAFPYIVLATSVAVVMFASSKTLWASSVLSTIFSCLHILRNGEAKHIFVSALLTVYLLYASFLNKNCLM